MRTLHISILDKKATYLNRDGDIVCGNSDYVIEFAFDAEWATHEEKIARFIWNGHYKDVTFTGTTCPVPIITNTTAVEIGVYAGELSTTTPAIIACQKSILCQSTAPGGIPFTKGEKGDKGDTGYLEVIEVASFDELPDDAKDGTMAIIPQPGGKCLYNGVELPDINEVWTDKTTYPYAYLTADDNKGYRLCLSSIPLVYISYVNGLLAGLPPYDMAESKIIDGMWDGLLRSAFNGVPDNFVGSFDAPGLFWASVDVRKDRVDGDIYLAASEAVTAAQYAVRKNGKWYVGDEGAKSWNDLTDKPFYEEMRNLGDTITWDGTPTGTEIRYDLIAACHVSDSTPSAEELVGCTLGVSMMGESLSFNITADEISSYSDDGSIFAVIPNIEGDNLPFVLVTREDGVSLDGFVIAKKGIYFILLSDDNESIFTTSLTIKGYSFTKNVVHKIDEKYLSGNLPEVVLTTPIDYDFSSFTDAENAAITAAASMNMPVIFKGMFEGMPCSAILDSVNGLGMVGMVLGMMVALQQAEDGKWYPYAEDVLSDIDRLGSDVDYLRYQLDEERMRIDENVADIKELKNGSALPPVTASDNGKFLQVVDGKYALVTLTDVSKGGM